MSGTNGKVALVRTDHRARSAAPTAPRRRGPRLRRVRHRQRLRGIAPTAPLSNTTAPPDAAGHGHRPNNADFNAVPRPRPSTAGIRRPRVAGLRSTTSRARPTCRRTPAGPSSTCRASSPRTGNGFWMQSTRPGPRTRPARASSSSAAPPPGRRRGHRHRRRGRVPTRRQLRHQPDHHRDRQPGRHVVSTGNALPEPVDIGTDRVPRGGHRRRRDGSVETSGSFDPAHRRDRLLRVDGGHAGPVPDAEVVGPTALSRRSPSCRAMPVRAPPAAASCAPRRLQPRAGHPRRRPRSPRRSDPGGQHRRPRRGSVDRRARLLVRELRAPSRQRAHRLADRAPRETTTPALDDELPWRRTTSRTFPCRPPAEVRRPRGNRRQPGLRPTCSRWRRSRTTTARPTTGRRGRRDAPPADRGDPRAGGPAYEWRQIDPVDGAEGGQPGGNIRVAFLFRTDRGLKFVDRGYAVLHRGHPGLTGRQGPGHLSRPPAGSTRVRRLGQLAGAARRRVQVAR